MRYVVGIPTFNRYDRLEECLKSIQASTPPPERIFVIDNGASGTSGGGGGYVQGKGIQGNVVVIPMSTNIGVAAAWNLLYRINSQVPLVICNDDIVFAPDALARLIDGEGDINRLFAWSAFYQKQIVWEIVGPYDEDFFPAYFEDNDYYRRATLKGMTVHHISTAGSSHIGSATMAALDPDEQWFLHTRIVRNRERYERKWGGLPGEERFSVPFNPNDGGPVDLEAEPVEVPSFPKLIELPQRGGSNFWESHVEYVIGTIRAVPGIAIHFTDTLTVLDPLRFQIRIDGRLGLLDVRDGSEPTPGQAEQAFVLRLTYTAAQAPHRHMIPFPSISFHDWAQYANLVQEAPFTAAGDTILASFNPRIDEPMHRDTTRRRLYVQGLLRHVYGDSVDCSRTDQVTFWRRALSSLVAVHVPGSSNHAFDRSQHQLFGLGCCTITPVIHMYLSTRPPEPWEHYVPCLDDYDDLIDKIEWCRGNRAECMAIGRRAQRFFEEQSTPMAIWAHIKRRLTCLPV